MWSLAAQEHFFKEVQLAIKWVVAAIVFKSKAKRMVVTLLMVKATMDSLFEA